jgi:IS5 family transposase
MDQPFERMMPHGRLTRREWFLQAMNDIIPWSEWVDYIYTQCPSPWLNLPSNRMETLLRLYLLQTWYNQNEEMILDSVSDSLAMRAFLGDSRGDLPDTKDMVQFRVMLENERISERLSGSIHRALHRGGAVLRGGSLVDASIIRAPRMIPEIMEQLRSLPRDS